VARSRPGGGAAFRPDVELSGHEVDPERLFRDRVLHLEARVHFEEVEVPSGVEQELDRPGAAIPDGAPRGNRGLPHLPAGPFVDRGGRLFDDLLVASLDRAFPFEERDHGSARVAENLDLDVPGPVERLLQVDGRVRESSDRFPTGSRESGLEILDAIDAPHPLAPTAGGRLDEDRESERPGRRRKAASSPGCP
jgi:hypothetical protein